MAIKKLKVLTDDTVSNAELKWNKKSSNYTIPKTLIDENSLSKQINLGDEKICKDIGKYYYYLIHEFLP